MNVIILYYCFTGFENSRGSSAPTNPPPPPPPPPPPQWFSYGGAEPTTKTEIIAVTWRPEPIEFNR